MGNRMYGAAITELRRAIELSAGSSKFLSNLAYAFGVAGRKGEAAKILQYFESRTQQGFLHFANLASVYAGLDDKDESFAWLEKAYEQRLDPEVLSWPTFDTLRQDGRFRNLMRRVGLPT